MSSVIYLDFSHFLPERVIIACMVDGTAALGTYLRKLRGDTDLRAFAEKLHISHTTLQNLEAGREPKLGTVLAIAEGLGMSPAELLEAADQEQSPYLIQAKSEERYNKLLAYDRFLEQEEERETKKTGA